jgi:hypothetical protein
MKYIKSINEYSRTVGFRYSKPKESFHAILFFVGKLDESSFQSILNNIDVTYESLSVRYEEDIIEVRVGDEIKEVVIDGKVEFDLLVYNEKELFSIFEDILRICDVEFNVQISDFNTKENPKMNK